MKKYLFSILTMVCMMFIFAPTMETKAATTITPVITSKVDTDQFTDCVTKKYTASDTQKYAYDDYVLTVKEDGILAIRNTLVDRSRTYGECYNVLSTSPDFLSLLGERCGYSYHGEVATVQLFYVPVVKGTYYLRNGIGYSYYSDFSATSKLAVNFTPMSKVIKVTQKRTNDGGVLCTVDTSNLGALADFSVKYGVVTTKDIADDSAVWYNCRYYEDHPDFFKNSEYYDEKYSCFFEQPNNCFKAYKNTTYTVRARVTSRNGCADLKSYYGLCTFKVTQCTGDDKVAPTVAGVKNNGIYKRSVSVKVSDAGCGVDKVYLNNKAVTHSFTISKSGKYKLTTSDKVGNSKTIKFTIDKEKPTIKGIKNGKTYKKRVAIKFSDKYSGVRKVLLNGKQVKLKKGALIVKKKGIYGLIAFDKAGNKREITFKVK